MRQRLRLVAPGAAKSRNEYEAPVMLVNCDELGRARALIQNVSQSGRRTLPIKRVGWRQGGRGRGTFLRMVTKCCRPWSVPPRGKRVGGSVLSLTQRPLAGSIRGNSHPGMLFYCLGSVVDHFQFLAARYRRYPKAGQDVSTECQPAHNCWRGLRGACGSDIAGSEIGEGDRKGGPINV